MDLFIKNIEVNNYKAFSGNYRFSLKDRFTVFIGDNATGKTSILNAIRVLLFFIFPNLSKENYGRNLSKKTFYGLSSILPGDDVHANIDPNNGFQILWPCEIKIVGKTFHLGVKRMNKKGGCRPIASNEAIKIVNTYLQEICETKRNIHRIRTINLPLLAYYGTERMESHGGKRFDRQHHPWDGYKDCLNQKISAITFKEWFKELQNLSKNEITKTTYEPLLLLFKQSLKECFNKDNIIDLYYQEKIFNAELQKYEIVNDIILVIQKENTEERILMRNLSAGYRIMLSLTSDIIMRCIILNDHLGELAIKETEGVVLIDEIDLHLHPLWQRHIVSDLMRCFPKIQFIATTHSPFIIQSLKKEQVFSLQTMQFLEENPIDNTIDVSIQNMDISFRRSDDFIKRNNIARQFLEEINAPNITSKDRENVFHRYSVEFSEDPTFLAQLQFLEITNDIQL